MKKSELIDALRASIALDGDTDVWREVEALLLAKTKALAQFQGDGWIAWRGRYLSPIALPQTVAVRFRNGGERATRNAEDLNWAHTGADTDIVAYKVIR